MNTVALVEWIGRRVPTALWRGRVDRRAIALTIDDGPHPRDTPRLLDLLAGMQIPATFFHVGAKVDALPHLTHAVAAHGHTIGIHGYHHHSFLFKRRQTLRDELARTQRAIAAAVGCLPAGIDLVRPPYGHFAPSILRDLTTWGYRPVMWTLAPFHWLQSTQRTLREIERTVCPGAILVLHEGLPGPGVCELVHAIVPPVLAQGYHFVSVAQLWDEAHAVH